MRSGCPGSLWASAAHAVGVETCLPDGFPPPVSDALNFPLASLGGRRMVVAWK